MSTTRSASLKRRFILFISSVIVILSLVLGMLFFWNSRSLLYAELDRNGKLITRQLAYGADVGIVNNAVNYLDQKIANFTDDSNVAFVIFRAKNGEVKRDWFRETRMRDEVQKQPDAENYNYNGYEIRHIMMPVTSVTTSLSDDLLGVFGDESAGASSSAPEIKIETVGQVEVGISTSQVLSRLSQLAVTSLLLVGSSVLLAILLSYIFIEITTRPLRRMVDAARSVAGGNLVESIDVDTDDEIGELGRSFNFMVENLRELFQRIHGASLSLSDVSSKVAESSRGVLEGASTQRESVEDMSRYIKDMSAALKETKEMTDSLAVSAVESSTSITEMGATINEVDSSMEILNQAVRETTLSIEEIGSSIAEISANVNRLTSAANETATSMLEIDSSVKQVEGNSRETTALSEKVMHDAERGRESVQKTISGITKIRESSQQIDRVIINLEEKTSKIGSILNVIDEIADQTNLLALNAAISAAQAGESGKAFAVVADEIKELAERTSTSTKEINDLITSLQDESRNAVRAMEVGNRSIEVGVDLANAAGGALEEIYNSAKRSSEMIREISRATNEQAKGSHQVTMAINQIVDMCERIGRATEEQKSRSQQIVAAADRMKNIAQQVKQTTREQNAGSKLITAAIENINHNISNISRNSDEQSRNSDQVVKGVETIREITNRNQQNVTALEGVTEVLNRQTEALKELVKRFQL